MPGLNSCIPFPIDEATLDDLIPKATDWALLNGAALRSKVNFSPDSLQFVPFILIPTRFPRREFEKAVRLQPILNELMHAVAHDTEFLRETLANTMKADELIRKLFNIHERILAENDLALEQPSLGIFRSDYMLHSLGSNKIKQVEINTMAPGFAGITSSLNQLHSLVLSELNHDDKIKNIPKSDALAASCDAMIAAWNLHSNPDAAILFVITEGPISSIYDQRLHEFYIHKMCPEIKIIRRTLPEVYQQAKLGPKNELLINNREVGVVHFRGAFLPEDFPSQNEWDARYTIEKSTAIKCPPIHYQLAGTKTVQQALAKPGVLKRFLKDDAKIKAITDIFVGLYSMDSHTEEGKNALQMALNDPTKYVLKPQREGGGHNTFGQDIPNALLKMSEVERSAYILMERICPPISKGYMIRPGQTTTPTPVDLVSELGIFGTIIGNKNGIAHNSHCGHMVRTKLASENEVSVLCGFGAVDSPYLYDD